MQVAARREAQRQRVHERRASAGAACDGASSATDRERIRGCRRARRAESSRRSPRPHRGERLARSGARARRSASAGRRRRGRGLRCRRSCRPAVRARSPQSSLPCRIRSRGSSAHVGRTAGRSREATRRTLPRTRGSNASIARCCAGDIRPCRSTNVRTGLGRGEVCASSPTIAGRSLRVVAPPGRIVRGGARASPRRRPRGVYSMTSVSEPPSTRRRRRPMPRAASRRAPFARRPGHPPHGELVDAVPTRRNRRWRVASGPARASARRAGRTDARWSAAGSRRMTLPPSVTNRTTALISLTKSQSANVRPPFSASVSVNVTVPARIERDLERIAVARREIGQALQAGWPRPGVRNSPTPRLTRTRRPIRPSDSGAALRARRRR